MKVKYNPNSLWILSIRYLNNNEINYYRWDRCIKNSFNSLIYAYSWYLNTVCHNWDALIEDDYEAVMPLPIVKRLGFKGIKTPRFISRLGIFSSKLIGPEKIEEFLKAIPLNILFINLKINKFNRTGWKCQKIAEKSHFELDLVKPYNKIASNYDESLKDKLNKAKKYKLSSLKGIPPNELLDLSKSQVTFNNYPSDEENFKLLRILISTSLRYHIGELFGVYDAFNNLCSAAFFIWSENSAILLYCCTTSEGIKEFAFQLLVDHFIQLYCGRFITLIFDYSESPECVEVYKQFGAIESKYQIVIKNRLPIISAWLNHS